MINVALPYLCHLQYCSDFNLRLQYTHHDNSTAIFHILYTDCVICNSKTKSILYLLNSIFFYSDHQKAAPNKKKLLPAYTVLPAFIFTS